MTDSPSQETRAAAMAPSGRSLAVRGSLWTVFSYGSTQILRLGINLVMARLLFPDAFGLMALVNIFMQGLQMVSDIGLGPSVIQNKRGEEPAFLRTAWTIQIVRGFGLWLLACVLAYPVTQFYSANDPYAASLAVLLPVSALVAVIGGFNSLSLFLLNRAMNIGRLTALQLVPVLISTVVMVGWALISPSVWALVAGNLALSLSRMVLSHLWNPGPRDRLGWDRGCFDEIFHFGKWVFISSLVTFFASNLDRIMLGKMLSMAELGIYNIAMNLVGIAATLAGSLSSMVIFPLLARLQDQPARLVDACLRARGLVLWMAGVACVGFALVAPLFFTGLYDPRYHSAGHLSQWLALFVWSQVLSAGMDRIPLSLGQPRILFNANVLTTVGMVLAFPGYLAFGMPGFIVGLALANLVSHGYLIATLPHGRGPMLRQSAAFTFGLLAYGLPLVLLLRSERLADSPALELLAVGLATGPLALFGAWKVWRGVRAPKPDNA